MKDSDAKNLVGCCGLYCGLCSKYQSKSPSRCIGCGLGEQHSWCSIWNCSVKKRGFENCTGCADLFKCEIFQRRKVAEWVPAAGNLNKIKKSGLKNWLKEQTQRQALLEGLLEDYNEGRSMNLYCKFCARVPFKSIEKAMNEVEEKIAIEKTAKTDLKSKAKIVRKIIQDVAAKSKINLD